MQGLEHYQPRQYFSVSSLSNAARCLRRYFYSSGCRLVPAGGEHVALKFGEAIHAALPLAYHQKLDESYKEFLRIWGDTPPDDKRNPTSAKLMLVDFAMSHRPGYSFYELVPAPKGDIEISDRVSEYEVPFAIDIGLGIPLVGRIDGLCKHRDTKELWALEFKTASELSTRFLAGFEWNAQVFAYTLALRVYTNQVVRGCMIEALLVSKTRQSTQIQPVMVSDIQLDDFVTWARFWGSMILECEKKKEFPKIISGCHPYGMFGSIGYTCDYTHLCSGQDWTAMKDFYRVKNDQPFNIVKAVPLPENIPPKQLVTE